MARDVVDGALVRALEGEGAALGDHAVGADAVLLLEAAQLLDELVLGELEGQLMPDLLVEGDRVVLVRRERGAPPRRELQEPAQDEQLLLVRPQPLEQPPRFLRRRGRGRGRGRSLWVRRWRRRRRNWTGWFGGWRWGRVIGEGWWFLGSSWVGVI